MSAMESFRADLLNRVGEIVRHSGGSGGVYECSALGTPTELWSYSNAVAYTGAVSDVLRVLDAAIARDAT